jgi:hypothetical protein
MSVLGDVGWEIVEDDMHDVWDIETTSGNGGGYEDRSTTALEGVQCSFTLTLSPVTVDRGSRESLGAKEVAEHVGHALGFDEDEHQTTRCFGVDDVEEERTLVVIVNIFDLLSDVLGGGTDSADREEDVFLKQQYQVISTPAQKGQNTIWTQLTFKKSLANI